MTKQNGKDSAVTDDRQDKANGQWAKGNRGGPGNPRAAMATKLRLAMDEATDPDVIKAIWRKAQTMALQGNEKMIVYVIDRVAGKPKETVEIGGGIEVLVQLVRDGMEKLEGREAHVIDV